MNFNNLTDILNKIIKENPDKFIISNNRNKSLEGYIKKIIIRKYENKNYSYQIEKFTEKQAFHENIKQDELLDILLEYSKTYKQINVLSTDNEYEIKFNKKLDFIVNNRSICNSNSENNNVKIKAKEFGNNRKKNYILNEGDEIPVFVELGIFTKDYKIVNSMYDKFKQINRFVELMDDMLKNYDNKIINVIDFGCGKSYLTFVVYYYLTKVRGLEANIVGIDLKTDVIMKCNKLSEKYDYSGLKFELGNIKGYNAPFDVNMVISLHACDVATDYALFNAVNWNADMIMSVPCCQHEINKNISTDVFSALTKYGIVKERVSSLITDAVRGCVLEYKGYKTELLEFVDLEHSPKNILIRAKKTNVSKEKKERSLAEARALKNEFNFEQSLMKMFDL